MPLTDEASRQTTRCRRLGRAQRDPTPRAGRAMLLGLVKNSTQLRQNSGRRSQREITQGGREWRLNAGLKDHGGSDPHARFVAPADGGFLGTGMPQVVDQDRCSVNDGGEKVAEWRGACRCPDCMSTVTPG